MRKTKKKRKEEERKNIYKLKQSRQFVLNQNQTLTNLNTKDFKLLSWRFVAFSLFDFQLFCFYWPFLAFFPFDGLLFSRNLMGKKSKKNEKKQSWPFPPICSHLSLCFVILPPHPTSNSSTLLFLPNAPFGQNLPLMFLKAPFPLCSSFFD